MVNCGFYIDQERSTYGLLGNPPAKLLFWDVFNIMFNLFLICAALLEKGVIVTIRSELYFLWHLCRCWAGVNYIQETIHWNRTVLSHFCCTYPSQLSIDKQADFPQKHEHCFLHIFGPGQMIPQPLVTLQELMQVKSLSAPMAFSQAHTASLGQFASTSAWIQPIQTSMKVFPQENMIFWIHPSIPRYPWGSSQRWKNSISKLLPLHSCKGPQCPMQHEIVSQQHLIFTPEVKGLLYTDIRKRKSPTSLRTESWCSNISDLAVLA